MHEVTPEGICLLWRRDRKPFFCYNETMHTKINRTLFAGLLLVSHLPIVGAVDAPATPFERNLIITAYYSPLEGQCCYVKGSLEDDRVLNGQGVRGADGTAVYPGMAAAPKSYAFGTRIELPGIGIVTVHDRGGAIVDGKDTDRLDLWMGSGEEGLARALEFGVQRVRATIYPPTASLPVEKFSLDDFASPVERVQPYQLEDTTLMDIRVTLGDHSASAAMLQEALKSAGFAVTGKKATFDESTRASLRSFLDEAGLSEPDDRLTPRAAAHLLAAMNHRHDPDRLNSPIREGSPADAVAEAKTVLYTIGRYSGPIDGRYDDELRDTVKQLQLSSGIIDGPEDTGAGQIGPKTLIVLNRLWKIRSASIDAEDALALRASPFGTQVHEALVAYRSH